MRTTRVLPVIAALLAVVPGRAAAGEPTGDCVAMTIAHNGRVIGAPRLSLAAGGTADVTVQGIHGFAVSTSLKAGNVPDQRVVTSRIQLERDGDMVTIAMPTVQLRIGERAALSFPDGNGGRLDYTVTVQDTAGR